MLVQSLFFLLLNARPHKGEYLGAADAKPDVQESLQSTMNESLFLMNDMFRAQYVHMKSMVLDDNDWILVVKDPFIQLHRRVNSGIVEIAELKFQTLLYDNLKRFVYLINQYLSSTCHDLDVTKTANA